MSSRKLPAPQPNPETRAFWDGLSEGVLRIKICADCGRSHYFPRHVCPHCGSMQTSWLDTAGLGEIYSVSVMRRGEGAPFAVAWVVLDEGPAMMTNLVADDLDGLAIGQRVRLVPQPVDGDAAEAGEAAFLPFFTPVGV